MEDARSTCSALVSGTFMNMTNITSLTDGLLDTCETFNVVDDIVHLIMSFDGGRGMNVFNISSNNLCSPEFGLSVAVVPECATRDSCKAYACSPKENVPKENVPLVTQNGLNLTLCTFVCGLDAASISHAVIGVANAVTTVCEVN